MAYLGFYHVQNTVANDESGSPNVYGSSPSKIAPAKLARKSVPRPSTTASLSPSVEVIGNKRPNESEDMGRGPPKVERTEGGSDVGVQHEGLHVLQVGVAAGKLVLPPAFGYGRMLDKNTKVVLSEAEKIILSDMGPEAMRAEIADATVGAFKLLEIANFLNGRECKYLKERDDAWKQVQKLEQDLNELQASYEAYQEKYALQISLTITLARKEEEVEKLTKRKEALVLVAKMQRAKIAELEDQLKTSVGPSVADEEESSVDPLGEFAGFSRAALIAKIMEDEYAILDVAKWSFDNAVAQIKCLNPTVKLVTEGLSELKKVHDGVLVSSPPEK